MLSCSFDDFLEIPLQPLYDNLDAYTYEVFEQDPVKYLAYQRAIQQAVIDKVPEAEIETRTLILMVVGAGRGPLVRAAINAAEITKRKIKIFVIEKNPNAVITLTALINEMWSDKGLSLISPYFFAIGFNHHNCRYQTDFLRHARLYATRESRYSRFRVARLIRRQRTLTGMSGRSPETPQGRRRQHSQ